MFLSAPRFNEDQKCMTPGPGAYNPKDWSNVLHMAPTGTPGSRSRPSLLPRPSLSNIPAVRQKQLDKLIQTLEELVMTKDNEIMVLQEQLKNEKDQYARERQALSEELEQAKRARVELEKLVPTNQAQAETIERLQTALAALETTHKSKVSELETCCREKEDLKTELQVAQDLLSREYAKTESLSDELAKAKAELESSSVANDETVKRLHAQHTEKSEGYLTLIRQLEEQVAAAESKLQAETLECSQRYEAWQVQTEQQTQKHQSLVAALEQHLEALKNQHDSTQQKLASSVGENTELLAQAQRLQDIIKALEHQLESLRKECAAIQGQLASCTTENTELRGQVRFLEATCGLMTSKHQQEIEQLGAQLEKSRNEQEQTAAEFRDTKQRLEGENHHLRLRIEEQSTSYTGQLAVLHEEIRTLVCSDKTKAQLLHAAEEANASLSKSLSSLTEAHQRSLTDIQEQSKELQRLMEEKATLLAGQSDLKLLKAQLESQVTTLTLQLEVQQSQAKTQTEGLLKELQESHSRVALLQQSNEEERQVAADLRLGVERSQAAARQSAHALAESEKRNEELRVLFENETKAMQGQVIAKEAILQAYISKQAELIEKLGATERQLRVSAEENAALRTEFAEKLGIAEQQLRASTEENASLKTEIQTLGEKISGVQSTNAALSDQVAELEKCCRNFESSLSDKEATYEQALVDLKSTHIGELQNVAAAAEGHRMQLESQIQTLQEQQDRSQKLLETAQEAVNTLKSEKAVLESELDTRAKDLAEVRELSKALEQQLEEANAEKNSLAVKNAEADGKINSLGKALQDKTLECDSTLLELKKMQETVCALTKSKDFAEEMVRELVLAKSLLTGQIEEQKAEVIELQAKILEMSSRYSALVAKEQEWGKLQETQANLLKEFEAQKEAATTAAQGYQQKVESLTREVAVLKSEQDAKIEEARMESEGQLAVVRLQIESEREEHTTRLTNLRICLNEEKQESAKVVSDLKEQHKQTVKLLEEKMEQQKRSYEEKLKDTKTQLDRIRREADSAASLAQLHTEKAAKLQDAKLQHYEKEKELAEKETKALKQKLVDSQKLVKEANEACSSQKEKYDAQIKALEKRLWDMGEKCQQEGKQNRELSLQVKSLAEKSKQAEQESGELRSTVAKLEAEVCAGKESRRAMEQMEIAKATAELEVVELKAMLDQANLEVGKALGEASLVFEKTSALAAHNNHKQKIHLHEQLKQENFALRKENLSLRVELKAAKEEARVRASLGPLSTSLPRLSMQPPSTKEAANNQIKPASNNNNNNNNNKSGKSNNQSQFDKKGRKMLGGRLTATGKVATTSTTTSTTTTTPTPISNIAPAEVEAEQEQQEQEQQQQQQQQQLQARKHLRDASVEQSSEILAEKDNDDDQNNESSLPQSPLQSLAQAKENQPEYNKENCSPTSISPTKQAKRVRLSDTGIVGGGANPVPLV